MPHFLLRCARHPPRRIALSHGRRGRLRCPALFLVSPQPLSRPRPVHNREPVWREQSLFYPLKNAGMYKMEAYGACMRPEIGRYAVGCGWRRRITGQRHVASWWGVTAEQVILSVGSVVTLSCLPLGAPRMYLCLASHPFLPPPPVDLFENHSAHSHRALRSMYDFRCMVFV